MHSPSKTIVMVKSNSVCPYLTSWMWSGKDYPVMLLVVKEDLTWNFLSQRLNFQCWVATHFPAHSPPLSDLPSTSFSLSLSIQQPIYHSLSAKDLLFIAKTEVLHREVAPVFVTNPPPYNHVPGAGFAIHVSNPTGYSGKIPGSHPWFFSFSHHPHSSRKFRSVNTHDSTFRILFDIRKCPPSTLCT